MLRFPCKAILPVLAAIAAATTGCAGAPATPVAEAPGRVTVEPRIADEAVGGAIADVAMGMVGTRYRYGGTDPIEGFDCSGLVYYAYGQAGYGVPRTSRELFRAARKISVGEADPGDLMFFQDQTKLSHVGIYLGDGLLRARAGERPERRRRQPRLAVLSRAPRRGRPAAAALSVHSRRRGSISRVGVARSRARSRARCVPLAALRRHAEPALIAARRRELVDSRARVEQLLLGRRRARRARAPGASSANASSSATRFCSRNTRSTYSRNSADASRSRWPSAVATAAHPDEQENAAQGDRAGEEP